MKKYQLKILAEDVKFIKYPAQQKKTSDKQETGVPAQLNLKNVYAQIKKFIAKLLKRVCIAFSNKCPAYFHIFLLS